MELTSFDIQGNNAVIGSSKGYFLVDLTTGKASGLNQKLPVTDITAVRVIGDRIWFGSSNGAFASRKDGKYDYFQGERWLPGNGVKSINPGPDNSVLIVTDAGLGQICFKSMTLHEKAQFFQQQVRQRHIRNGFNALFDFRRQGNGSSFL
jgi:ligand-binding sensor domain-containing protein